LQGKIRGGTGNKKKGKKRGTSAKLQAASERKDLFTFGKKKKKRNINRRKKQQPEKSKNGNQCLKGFLKRAS